MKTMHLNLHRKWFDMILSGRKKEEYRALSDYWKVRFKNFKLKGCETVTFSNGYAKDRRQMVVKVSYIATRGGIIEWGAKPDTHYIVIHLGEILSTKHCDQ